MIRPDDAHDARRCPARSNRGTPIAMLALLVGVGCTAGVSLAQQCVAPPPGAIYWLAGERDFDDQAGFFNGVANGGTEVAFVDGLVGKGMQFDNGSAYIYTGVLRDDAAAQRNAFTYDLWARPTRALGACDESADGTCGIGLPWAIYPENGTTFGLNGPGIGVAIGTNGVCVGQHAAVLASCLARIDTAISGWTHIAVVVEEKTPRIYINGVLAHTGIASTQPEVFASWRLIGYAALGQYTGDLDEVTVYDRALRDGEIAAVFAAGTAGKCKPACAVERSDDFWQGAVVTSNTPLSSTFPDGLIGGNGGSPEPNATLFANGLPDGTLHAIEWQTAAPFMLGSLGLYAFHDATDNPFRRMRHVRVQAREIGGTFATVYESPVLLPYAQGPAARELQRCPRVRPTYAQQFRAEFIQEGTNALSGPRIVELDGLPQDLIFREDFE